MLLLFYVWINIANADFTNVTETHHLIRNEITWWRNSP